MTKGSKKRPRRQSENSTTATTSDNDVGTGGGWRKVDVEFGLKNQTKQSDRNSLSKDQFPNDFDYDEDNDNSVDARILRENHYDNPQLASKALTDLEANPAEFAGVFLGLEVLDGSQYTVVIDKETGSKRLFENHGKKKLRDESEVGHQTSTVDKSPSPKEIATELTKKNEDKLEKQKKKRKKKKKKKNASDLGSKNVTAIDKQTADKETNDHSNGFASVNEAKDDSTNAGPQEIPNTEAGTVSLDEEISIVQSHWMPATGGVLFHNRLYESFVENKWYTPAPIQSAVLPAAILGRRNIVGAAPTGSGKTLAFLLPIYQHLLEQHDQYMLENNTEEVVDEENTNKLVSTTTTTTIQSRHRQPLQALILTPTRELALQIHAEGDKLWKGQIGSLVGGLAIAKQQRVLDKNRPPIITATPGRLWELVRLFFCVVVRLKSLFFVR
jgi:ATP-dependent RNA helicase DDX24/MAK5